MVHYVLDARTATPHFPGIGRYCRNLASALVPQLATDEYLTVLHAAAHPLNPPRSVQVETKSLDTSPFSIRQQWVVPRLLHQRKADLYHAAYYLMPYRPGICTVVTFYDLIPLQFPQFSTLRARLFFRLATCIAMQATDLGITISATVQQAYTASFKTAAGKLTAIPLAADPQFTPQTAHAIQMVREKYALPMGYLLYVGSNKPHKNLSTLVKAYASLREADVPLVIAGAWLPQHPEPRQLAGTLDLDNAIRWLGPVPGEDLPGLYAAAQLFVFPSLTEGFGLPVIEAMACGTPVACSRVPSLVEVAGDAVTYFDPMDVVALASTLNQLLHDEARREALRQQGLIRAAQFSWEQTAQATLSLYRRCL